MPQCLDSLGILIPGSYSFHQAVKLSVLEVSWIEKFLTNRKQPHVMTIFCVQILEGCLNVFLMFQVVILVQFFNHEKCSKRSLFNSSASTLTTILE